MTDQHSEAPEILEAYLTRDVAGNVVLATFDGRVLARVTYFREHRGRGFHRTRTTRTTYRATTPDGRKWYGTTSGFEMATRARLVK